VMVGHGVFRRDHHARGVFIQPMNNSRPDDPVDLREIPAVKEERIYKGPRINPSARMDHHARWLVDDDNPWILEEDIQGDILGVDVQFAG